MLRLNLNGNAGKPMAKINVPYPLPASISTGGSPNFLHIRIFSISSAHQVHRSVPYIRAPSFHPQGLYHKLPASSVPVSGNTSRPGGGETEEEVVVWIGSIISDGFLSSRRYPHNAPAAPDQGGSSSTPTGSAHSTATPTPNTINSSITQSPASNGTPSVPPASNPPSQPQPSLSDLPPNFIQTSCNL
ncbi:hypothetical protein P692DRAFT_20870840 [Suillus brevipes Sb2]|nr:hypothetical protein P692DRAFT_20870840 [Suillus brevipes Sb2]